MRLDNESSLNTSHPVDGVFDLVLEFGLISLLLLSRGASCLPHSDTATSAQYVGGSLFDKQDASQEIKSNEMSPNSKSKSKIPTSGWDVSRLDSLLSRTLREKNITLSGVNSSYLYFGMWRSLFAWHTEDCDLYSVNYLHYGTLFF